MPITLGASVVIAETDYGIVLLDEAEGQYWNLNETGTLVLQTLLAGATPHEASRALADSYGIDIETATSDVAELITELGKARLIRS